MAVIMLGGYGKDVECLGNTEPTTRNHQVQIAEDGKVELVGN